MNKHVCYAVMLWLAFIKGFSQQGLKRFIVNSRTGFAVDYVYVSSNDKKINLVSNNEGKIIIIPDSKVKWYSFYKLGYYPQNVTTETLLKNDTIFLVEKPFVLEEITVKGKKVIDTIIKDKRYYVDDYLVLPNNNFIVITSKINVKGFEISHYIKGKGITCTEKFKNENGAFLFTDCFKNIHLVTNNYSRQLFFQSDSIFDFLPKYNRTRFDSTLAICALKIDTQIVIKTSRPPIKIEQEYFDIKVNSPFLTFFIVGKNQKHFFHSVVYNKHMREMLDAEMNDSEMIRRSAKDIGVRSPSQEQIEAQRQLFFTKIATPIYAPIFLKNDTVIVFNFQENHISFLNKAGHLLKEIPIDEKAYSGLREFEVIYDTPKQKFYIRSREFDRCLLNRIDIYSGEISQKIKLEKVFAHNIQVLNDHVYYLVKEKQWDDTSYLYQQN